jgi:EF hand
MEHQPQGVQTPRRAIEDDIGDDGGMMGWRYGPAWRHQQDWDRGAMGPGMMGRGGMGPGSMGMGSGMMMRMLFALMDSDGDGTVSLQEFQAAHERIFKAMDANKDGRLTLEEIQTFIAGNYKITSAAVEPHERSDEPPITEVPTEATRPAPCNDHAESRCAHLTSGLSLSAICEGDHTSEALPGYNRKGMAS